MDMLPSMDSCAPSMCQGGGADGREGSGLKTCCILLSSPDDSEFFSESVCLLRAQIEVFAAEQSDVDARSRKGGLQEPIRLGRVGIRCVNCNDTPHESRARGAVSYPESIRLVHQAFRNWKRYHFPRCKYIPEEIRERIEALESGSKRQYSTGKASKDFWCRHLERIGLADSKDDNGIIFAAGSGDAANDEGTGANLSGSNTAESRKGSGKEVEGIRVESAVAQHSSTVDGNTKQCHDTPAFAPIDHSEQEAQLQGGDAHTPQEGEYEANGFREDGGHGLGSLDHSSTDFCLEDIFDDKETENCTIPYDAPNNTQEPMSSAQGPAQSILGAVGRNAPNQLHERREHILKLTRLAHELVKTTCQMKADAPVAGAQIAPEHVPDARDSPKALFSLGTDLYELFTNRHPFEESHDHKGAEVASTSKSTEALSARREWQQMEGEGLVEKRAFAPLREMGFPISLCILVSNLLDPGSSPCPYESFEDVDWALNSMVSDPERFLFDSDGSIAVASSAISTISDGLPTDQASESEPGEKTVEQYHHLLESKVLECTDTANVDVHSRPDTHSTSGSSSNLSLGIGHSTVGGVDVTPLEVSATVDTDLYRSQIVQDFFDTDLLEHLKLSEALDAAVTDDVGVSLPSELTLGAAPVHVPQERNVPVQHDLPDVPTGVSFGGEGGTVTQGDPMEQRVVGKIHLAVDVFPVLSETSDVSRNGLFSLGVNLYELFAERHPFHSGSSDGEPRSVAAEDSVQRKKREKKLTRREYIPLRELGFPFTLCDLVSSLLQMKEDKGNDRYQSADEVKEDLQLMASNPHRFLLNPDLNSNLNFLCDTPLYGRETHVATLMNAFERVIASDGPCEMVLASGYSGTGKTALMRQVRSPLTERGGYFIAGKFDALRQAQPLSAIVAAFNDYCDTLVTRDAETVTETRTAIIDGVGDDASVLTVLIPHLHKVIGEPRGTPTLIGGKEAHNRLIFFFRKFLQVISSPSHPIILFLDDLQWADEMSLELIRTLVTDKQTTSFLFLGCYRDNEVTQDHPLALQLQAIERSGTSINTICVNNLSREMVNELISDNLHSLPRLTQPLATAVFNKTSGNAFFVVQFLISLHDEGLLRFSLDSRRWEWDLEAIQSRNIDDNVVELMTSKMLRLAPEVLWGLQMASCLGVQCDESALKYLDVREDSNPKSLSPLLDISVSEGLMNKVGPTYKFSHDQIQQAAHSLIPPCERPKRHLQIGRLLRDHASAEEMEGIIFVVVDQLQRGVDLIINHEERVKVAGLCLMAGKKAIQSSSFTSASLYLLQGTALLSNNDWENHYDLTLELFTCCAEAQYVTANYDGVVITSNPILAGGKCLQDKVRAHFALMNSLGSQGKPLDAIRYGLDILTELGETFPSEINQGITMKEVGKTMALLGQFTTDAILGSPLMQDKSKLAAMNFLGRACAYAFTAKQELMPLLTCRMVQICLRHGLCSKSAVGFSMFASILCRSTAGLDNGYRYGKLAISLMEGLNAREAEAKVCSIVYGNINIFKEPLQACLEKFRQSYESAMSTGDIESARISLVTYTVIGFQSGCKLETWADQGRVYTQQLGCYNMKYLDAVTEIYLQAASNLMGSPEASDDPTSLDGGFINEQVLVDQAQGKQNVPLALSNVYFVRMWLAYIFGRYDVAGEMAERRRAVTQSRTMRPATIVNESFYSGLIAATLARSSNGAGQRGAVQEAREKMEEWASHSEWNCQHKLEAMTAEIAYLDGDLDEAARAYDAAIKSAGNHGFVHEQAMICERAGMFYAETTSQEAAKAYFDRSCECYLLWGAKRKVDELLERMAIS